MSNRSVQLVGDGVVITADISRAEQLKGVAKRLGLRRLLPVQETRRPSFSKGQTTQPVVACAACGRASPCGEMVADLDGPPYKAYYHPGCAGDAR